MLNICPTVTYANLCQFLLYKQASRSDTKTMSQARKCQTVKNVSDLCLNVGPQCGLKLFGEIFNQSIVLLLFFFLFLIFTTQAKNMEQLVVRACEAAVSSVLAFEGSAVWEQQNQEF